MLYSILSNRLRQKKAILLSFLALFCVLTAQAQDRIYVSPDGKGDGSSWDATMKLGDALDKAQAGDEIWLKGFQQITDTSHLYVAPKNGWTVPSGVKIYGGFEGSETNINQRKTLGKAYQMTYRSVLSGDRGVLTSDVVTDDDVINPNYSIFPENTTRSDNAKHVLVLNAFRDKGDNLNDNSYPTVVDGLTIAGGHAADFGGGIYVKGGTECVPYSIDHCYLLNNYAPQGGAIYVDASVKKVATQSLINQCVVYNNVAGTVIGKNNSGGGIYIAGAGNIVNCSVFNNENGGVVLSPDAYLVNTTVARNTGAGVDMTASPVPTEAHVYNSVIWGNSFVAAANWPVFNHSAYPDAPAENNNINLSKNNQGDEMSPRFDAPSLKTSFDIDYDWRRNAYPLWSWKLREGSYLINKGNNDAYNTYAKGYNGVIGTDLNGTTRIVGKIDINAYEFEAVPASRIRYVKTDGSDSNNGQSWGTAYKSIQKAINDLALSQPGVPGEVWVAAGEYEPTELINGTGTPASFRMYDGISLYGGFAGTETKKSERTREGGNPMPWQFVNETVLRGSTYNGTNTWNPTDKKWSLTSASTHVVWFAPLPNQADFQNITVMEGFTIEGGQAKVSEANNYEGDKGAGVYMQGANVYLIHSIVKDNVAPSVGGGIYQKGGRVQGCLVYNNSSETNGGGIYVDNAGLVLRSMITNNSAKNGGGVYLDNNGEWEDGMMHPEYLILSTSIVTNNTSVNNGAVYCNKGGVILQSTIANNNTPTATDNASGNASQTGGLYINEYSTVVNTVLWNNLINGRKVQLYALNPTAEKVQFHYSAVANMNNIVWNNTLQNELLELSEENRNSAEGGVDPGFTDGLPASVGVQGETSDIIYFWQPITGSNLRARGMSLGLLPENVLVAPELDITGKLFDQKPAVGAYRVEKTPIKPEETNSYIRIYVDVESTDPDADGSSWDAAYRSLNEAIDYMANLTGVDSKELQIYVMEGDAWPRYAFVNQDVKSATIQVPAMASGKTLTIKGGYSRDNQGTWAPLTYRTQINGNHEGKNIEDGLYHCITVEKGANVEFDGFHIINGYAAGTANLKYGAGMLVRDGANVTVKNSIFENHTAVEGAAIDARGATLSLINCVVNNNTNTTNTASVINCPNLTMNHVSVVNNVGAAPASMGTSSFSAGNTSSDNTFKFASVGADGYKNFANPTNKQGASLGFDTYLGGYSNFAPLTSSADAGNLINKASGTPAGLDQDIAGNERNLGGAPDLGAYEAALPETGRVYYVKETGNDLNDGLSWDRPLRTIREAVKLAARGEVINGEKPQVWVAAGNYAQDPLDGSNNCFDILEGVNVYGSFPKTGTPNMSERHPFISDEVYHDPQYNPADYETILRPLTANKSVRRVLGQSDEYNPFDSNWSGTERYVYVGAGMGDYISDFKYVEESDGSYVYSVNGGEYYEAEKSICDVLKVTEEGYYEVGKNDEPTHKYCTESEREAYPTSYWGQPDGEKKYFVQVGSGKGNYKLTEQGVFNRWWKYTSDSNGEWVEYDSNVKYYPATLNFATYKELNSGYYNVSEGYGNCIKLVRGWNYVGAGYGTHSLKGGIYTKVESGKGDYIKTTSNSFVLKTTWDGFTIRDGYIDSKNIKYLGSNGKRNGGAGVVLFTNVTLANSIIVGNTNNSSNNEGFIRGGGIYCDQGTLVNCYITSNTLGDSNESESYGGGCYMYSGTAYNCVISSNTTNGKNTDGAGIFIENAEFFNNTIVKNVSNGSERGNGGVSIYNSGASSKLVVYNCIVMDNQGFTGLNGRGNADIAIANNGIIECHNSLLGRDVNNVFVSNNTQISYKDCSVENNNIFVDYNQNNFRLNGTAGLNTGNDMPEVNGKVIDLSVYTDMDFTNRIKDCTVDAGAYESDNETNLAYGTSTDGNTLTYYVNQNGSGLRNGSSVAHAACAMKLQQILTHAGQTAKDNLTKNVVVKIAGYGNAFVYHANTLSNPTDPQSYTYVIPYGVTVEGGYSEDFTKRVPKTYQTVLSAICNSATLEQDVNGYHTITFDAKPEGWTGAEKQTIIDGLYLIDGKATSMAGEGNPNTRGGGAIVPAWAHVRNCVVARCEAIQGGALYLMPGATVSGTLIMENKAEEGAGVYADAEGANATLRAHMISNTITDNTASEVGGGIYLKDGAVLTTNSVIWGNTAPSDKNVSGVVNSTFEDDKFTQVVGEGAIPEFYPFNHCYVETYEMPSNYENTSMKSNEELYFAADRTLKAYSELIKHGTVNQDKLVEVFDVATTDMQGIARKQEGSERIDVGAYAFDGGLIPLPKTSGDPVVTKIFVSQGSNVAVTGNMDDYIGRSFYTSLSWLDDALEYIKNVRNVEGLGNTEFEIYLAGGTYKPSNRRDDAATTTIDQRQNSYVIPAGIKIYGGFSGIEAFGYNVPNNTIKFMEEGSEKTISLTNVGTDASGLIDSRTYSDLNGNGIFEPWEMANQTILSGDINVSPSVKNAYHVVYSSGSGSILLDGLTIKDGETWNEMSSSAATDEVGRGGAIYTYGVNYILNGCRVMNSKAVRGGAIYSRDADMTIIGSVIGGNGTVDNPQTENGQDIRGGAIYMAALNKDISLKAVNTLWANNETTGKGGAIATSNDLAGYAGKVTVSLMNNTMVRNKAAEASAVYSTSDGTITNTVMWGGEETGNTKGAVSSGLAISYSASDSDLPSTVESENANNVKLNTSNMAIDGPRFAQPSSAAGVAANNVASQWNPASISVLTDAGNGVKMLDGSVPEKNAYDSWWSDDLADYKDQYMKNSDESNYLRYAGPLDENGQDQDKTIDIGLFEYQYKTVFKKMDDIYVDTQERGDGSGKDWGNATSDLRGAIIALSDPEGGSKTDKTVHIRGGEYPQSQLYVGDIAYQAKLNGTNQLLNSLTIKGSYAENGQQDFSQPTVFLPSPAKPVETMFYANTNGKTLNIEGVTFQGANTTGFDADNSGTLNLKNVAFRQNGTGAHIEGNGATLFANALFADGTTGLSTTTGSNVTVVNATFANNKTAGINGTVNLYNSVAWNSGNEITDDSAKGNINLHNVANDDVLNGPNFVNPEQGNYMIRPSIKLLDLANNDRYTTLVGALDGDKDLANNNRLTGDRLDIGAYEYNAQLQPVVYVKDNVVNSDGSGSSWENPISDLQSAIDLASIYANKNSQETAYVFVHKNANKSENIRLTMPRVKVYGGMNDEVAADASSLINARTSVLADKMSTINGLTVNGASSVIDGFKAQGTVTVTDGMLSTSVVEGDATVGTNGIVYNSFVRGTLSGDGKAVNVTSPVAVSVTSKINVVETAQSNGYVDTDIWKYQLKETDLGIDNQNAENVQRYIDMVGHSKDLSGSKRVRNIVDAGCFESWNITTNTTLSADDMPTNKHVVYVRKGVELDIEKDLYPDGTKFNVGFLLLEHGAGLRSNGNAINLTNFAVERNLDESNNRWDMCYMPFAIVKTEGANDVSVKTYDGAARAAYDYQFNAKDGAWVAATLQGGKGLLLQSEADATVRMYGEEYTEAAGQSGQVRLAKYNNMEPWSSPNDQSLKFTHLENMSWNMFGSPFLCAMDYKDMEYGRVIYKKGGDTYASENTAEASGGSIEAGSAVFTQTATLQTNEVFNVNQRTSALSEAGTRTRLAVAVAPQGQGGQDELTLTAVPTEEASDQFNMAADGVKMMTVGKAAQIYLERGGKHYSMLTALDLEGKIDVGVLAPESGMYSIFIPEDCPMEDYETVVLEDKATGRVVDLLEGAYDFQMNEAGTLNSRFTLSFNRELAKQGLTRIRIQAMGNGQVRITGLTDGDHVTAYQENGTMTYSQRVASAEKNIALPGKVCLIKVTAADGGEIVKKLVIR